MQLSEILEEHSLKNISKKTNISEENLEFLLEKRFEKLKKVKVMGFISIIEREYNTDLAALKSEAKAYYAEHDIPENGVIVTGMLVEERRGKSKWLFFIVLALLAYTSWYFVTQYNKSHSNTLQPVEDQAGEMEIISENDLNIIHSIKQKWKDIVNNEQKEANVIDTEAQSGEGKISETVVETIEPVEVHEEEPEETNVARVAEEE